MMDNNMFRRLQQNSIDKDEFELFSAFLLKNSGILIPPEKAYLFETRLAKMMLDAGTESFKAFYDYIQSGADPKATQRVIDAMTTNETLWFRDASPWKVLEDKVLPPLIEALQGGDRSRIRIWCAAVSTGQEVYSTAMCIDNYLKRHQIRGVTLSDFDFIATDISGRVLDIARKGRYDAISIRRGLDDYYRTKYFTQDGAAWIIDPIIQNAVEFIHYNLQNSFNSFGFFDIIFCRYILIYFPQHLKKDIISRMNDSLVDGGVLFVEKYTFFDLFEEDYNINHYDNYTYYTKRR